MFCPCFLRENGTFLMTDGWQRYTGGRGLGPEEWKGYFIYRSGASRELGLRRTVWGWWVCLRRDLGAAPVRWIPERPRVAWGRGGVWRPGGWLRLKEAVTQQPGWGLSVCQLWVLKNSLGTRLLDTKMLGSRNIPRTFSIHLCFSGKVINAHGNKESKQYEQGAEGENVSLHQKQSLSQFPVSPSRGIGLSWKVSTSRKALLLHGWAGTFAWSFPPIFMLIHPVACVLLDMPIFFPTLLWGEITFSGPNSHLISFIFNQPLHPFLFASYFHELTHFWDFAGSLRKCEQNVWLQYIAPGIFCPGAAAPGAGNLP